MILKNYHHALSDLCMAKSLSNGQYNEIENLITEVRRIQKREDSPGKATQEGNNFQSFDISRSRQKAQVNKMSHSSLLGENMNQLSRGTLEPIERDILPEKAIN